MENHGRHRESFHDNGDRPSSANRPQLPNFEYFVRSTGHPDLALRGTPRLETAFKSPPSEQSPLPTPPASTGLQSVWLPNSRKDYSWDHQSAVLEDHEMQHIEQGRRASVVLPMQSAPQPRPSRAYSSSTVMSYDAGPVSWQQGRVIQEEEVPGRGVCYVYDDGTLCPKEINGDTVNPKWGTTKAGKPRKRLGQACNTCREKKIKCDPGFPKCSQCLRFNRECRFDANARQGHKSPKFSTSTDSPGTSTYSPREYLPSRKSSIAPSTEASTPTDVVYRTLSLSSNSVVDDVLSPTMSERQMSDAPTPSKRQRLNATLADRAVEKDDHDVFRRKACVSNAANHLGFAADVDPVLANDKLTRQYLNAFFDHINVATFEIFPKRRFTAWVLTSRNKSLQDRMMLYALMAWATTHSTDADRSEHRAAFRAIVYQELDRLESEYCLQLVHTLLFLAFAEFADSRHQKGFSIFVRCVGAIVFLRLHVEHMPEQLDAVYGFSSSMTAECGRRTYWATYITDTYAGLSKGDPRLLHNADIFLKLPCASENYEDDTIPELPMFCQDNILPKGLTAYDHIRMSSMIYLIEIATICSDVQLNSWRSQTSLRVGRRPVSDKLVREKLDVRLRQWADTYNDALRAKEGRTTDSDDPHSCNGGARAKKFAGLDILYHYTHMELNRRVYHRGLSEKEILGHARDATVHAIEVLKLAKQILEKGGGATRDYYFVTRGPLAGYAVLTAVDILTAAGKVQDILEPRAGIMTIMYNGLELLEVLATWWSSAKMQHMQVKDRVQNVFNSAQAAVNERKSFFFCSEPITPTEDKDFDLVYGSDRMVYLRAAYSNNIAIRDNEVYEISARDSEIRSARSGSL